MDNNDIKNTLAQAATEIRSLRRINELLDARVETFEKCFSLVRAELPRSTSMGMGEDIAWRIEMTLQEMNKAKK